MIVSLSHIDTNIACTLLVSAPPWPMSVAYLACDSFFSSIHLPLPSRHSCHPEFATHEWYFSLNFLTIVFVFPLFLYAFPIPLCLFSQIISHFLQFFTFRSIHLFYFYVYACSINNYCLFYFFAFQVVSSFQVSHSNTHSTIPSLLILWGCMLTDAPTPTLLL